jgi:Lamin Tail Domain
LNVPNTVGTFNVDFLVAAKAQAKLVINEVVANPGGTISDANGEWFEVTNTGAFPVNMLNFKIGDSAASGDRPLQTIPSDLIVNPGAFITFGNTSNTTNNGGVPIDHVYGAALALANSLDAVRIVSPVADLEIDRVSYLSAAVSTQNGISRELKNPALDNSNMDGANWADALVTSVYGPGGRGTPKAQNSGFTPFAGFSDVEDVNVVYSPEKRERPTISLSGETVNANLGTLAPGDYVDVTFKVTTSVPMPSGVNQLSVQGTVAGSNFTPVVTDDPATGTANDATVTPILSPTAGHSSLSGRIITPDGNGVKGVYVRIMGGSLDSPRIAITSPFGHYEFEDLQVGESYVVSVVSKSYAFETSVLVVTLNDQVTDADFRVIR